MVAFLTQVRPSDQKSGKLLPGICRNAENIQQLSIAGLHYSPNQIFLVSDRQRCLSWNTPKVWAP